MTISHTGIAITISGTETGDALRAYMVANSLHQVIGRDIIFTGVGAVGSANEILFQTGSSLTDSNSSWTFRDGYRWNFQSSGVTLTFTGMVLRRTGNNWGNDWYNNIGFNAVWDNVRFQLDTFSGRSDFFTNATFGFDLTNCNFTNYGDSLNVMHFVSASTVSDITITNNNTGTFIFEPGTANVNDTVTLNRFKLIDVSDIFGAVVGNGTAELNDLDWDALTWSVRKRTNKFEFINPIKPSGWLQYSVPFAESGTVKEFYTHDVLVRDEFNVAVQGTRVLLTRSVADGGATVYDETTDVQGQIPTQNVLTVDNLTASTTVTSYTDFRFSLIDYNYQFTESVKALQDGAIDEVAISISDPLVTELDSAVTATYTNVNSAQELYDSAKLDYVDNYVREESRITRNGDQIVLGTKTLTLDSTAANGYDKTTDTAKVSTYTGGVSATTGDVIVQGGALLDGGTFDCDISYATGPSTVDNIACTGTFDFTQAGTYNFNGCTVNEVTNSSGGNVTINRDTSTTITTNTGPNITIVSPVATFTINSSESGALIQIFTAGTQTVLDSTTGSSLAYQHANETIDYVIQKSGFIPQRFTGKALLGTESVTVTLVIDPVYNSAHGLTYTTDASYNRATKEVTVATTQDGDDIYSLFVDAFISETALRNTDFPIQMNGPGAAIFVDDAEFLDVASLNKWKRVGVQYLSSGDAVTAEYSAVFTLSSGIPAGAQAEYQQTAGSGTTDAINTGDIDELIQIYGDATHGNFTRNTHLVVKYQENTYQESRVDIPDLYDLTTIDPIAYPIPTPVVSIGITAGDPVVTGLTITNHGASPVSWDAGNGAKDYSLTITDTNSNTGENILRWLNYFMSLDATFQGEDPFNWPHMVEADGTKYRTERGVVEGSAGATLKGVRVIDGSSDPHPDFSEFTADDGTLGIPPVVNSVSITNLPTDGANTMLQIYNITTATEIYAADPGGAIYSATYTEGTDYTQGDEVRVRFAELNGATSFKRFETVVTAGAEGWSLNANNFIEEDAVYAINAVDGSTVTKFVYTPINDQFNLSVAQNFVAAELFAYYCFVLTTAAGIDGAYGSFEAQDAGNYKNITAIANIFLDNETTASQRQTDSARIYKDDGTYPVLDPTTSGFGIDINWQNVVYVVSTGGSSLTPSESAQLFATATQTSLDVVDGVVDSVLADTTQIKSDTAAILIDTNELQTDWANDGRLDLILDTRAAETSVTALQGDITAILADTNELQGDWANDGRLDLILDATATQTSVDAIQTDSTAIKDKTDQLTFTVTNVLDSNVEYVTAIDITGEGTEQNPWGPSGG